MKDVRPMIETGVELQKLRAAVSRLVDQNSHTSSLRPSLQQTSPPQPQTSDRHREMEGDSQRS
jgi:hypothetical protein